MLLVSGLQVGGKHDPLLVSLLVDFVAGYLGGAEDQEGTSARCGKVFVRDNVRGEFQRPHTFIESACCAVLLSMR